jgi:hypothetical protein
MPTLNGLVAQVKQQLLGYALTQETVSELTVSMTDTDTSFTVDATDVRGIARGLVEIEDELILVRRYDASTGVVTVMGGTNGRGYQGTTATTHAEGSLITSAPAYPTARIKEAVNDTISGMYADLPILATTEITKNAVVYQYEMPSAATDVWSVTGEVLGPTKVWQPMPNWRWVPNANTSDFPSGKSIQLMDEVVPGMKFRVVYVKEPTTLSSGSDDFTVTGYPSRVSDVVVWGACSRLAPAYEAGRLQQRAIEANERSNYVRPEAALQTAAYYQGLYTQALDRERKRLLEESPNYVTYQGS